MILAEEKQRQLFQEDLEQKIHFLSKDSQLANSKVEETLTKMRNEIDSHFEALQSEFNTLLSDPQVIIMDDDAEHEEYHSQTMDSQRDCAYNCIALAKHTTSREFSQAYTSWVEFQEKKQVLRVTRVNDEKTREQISKVVDATYATADLEKYANQPELKRVNDQVELLTKAVSKLLVDASKKPKSSPKQSRAKNSRRNKRSQRTKHQDNSTIHLWQPNEVRVLLATPSPSRVSKAVIANSASGLRKALSKRTPPGLWDTTPH